MAKFTRDDRILVTGASSGIGWAVSKKLAEDGAFVIASGRNQEKLEQLVSELGGPTCAAAEVKDLLEDVQSLDKWLKQLAAKHGRLKGAVFAAGVQYIAPLAHFPGGKIDELLQMNLVANILLAKGFCDRRTNNGSGCALVFVSSISSVIGEPAISVYSATKGAINSFVRSLAAEVAAKGIRVNSVLPGLVRTEMLDTWKAVYTPDYMAHAEKSTPLGVGEASDIAGPVSFMLSSEAGWMTGVNLVVDGGAFL